MRIRFAFGVLVSMAAVLAGVSEGARVERTPVDLVALGEDVVLCGGYVRDGGERGHWESGYWLRRIDTAGNEKWSRDVAAQDQEEAIAISVAGDALMLLGQRFLNGRGYLPFLQSVAADGNMGARVDIEAPGMPHALVARDDGTYVIAGSSDVSPEKSNREDDWDGWLLCVRPNGDIVWQKWFDRKKDEAIYAVIPADNGGFYCLANRGALDKFGSGESEAWLFEYSVDEGIMREATIPKGRFAATSGDGLLTRRGDQIVAVCSMPQAGTPSVVGALTFPARVVSFTSSLEEQWKIDYGNNHGVAVPRIAWTSGSIIMASAGARTPELVPISPQGELGDAMKGATWEFMPMLNLESLLVDGARAYVAGTVTDFMSDDEDGEKAFVACFDLEDKGVLWQKTF